MVCNTEFNRYQAEANFTYIGNYHSKDSLTVNDLKGHSYGDDFHDNKLDWTYEDQTAEHKFQFYSLDTPEIAKQTMATSYDSNMAWQRCGAEVRLDGYDENNTTQ